MTVQCDQIEKLIQAQLDRELPAARQQELRAHLQACEPCRTAYQPLLEAIDAAEQAPAPVMPARLLDRVLAELPTPSSQPVASAVRPIRRARRMAIWLRSSAAMAATLLLAVWVLRSASIPGGGAGQGEAGIRTARSHVDPHAVMWLAAASGTMPINGGPASLALATGHMAVAGQSTAAREPVRVAVCMALPPGSPDDPAHLVPTVRDVLEIVSNPAAVPGGL